MRWFTQSFFSALLGAGLMQATASVGISAPSLPMESWREQRAKSAHCKFGQAGQSGCDDLPWLPGQIADSTLTRTPIPRVIAMLHRHRSYRHARNIPNPCILKGSGQHDSAYGTENPREMEGYY